MERFIPCPVNQEGCKYAGTELGCHTSEHHIFPKRRADTKLKRAFGNLAINKVKACRNIHDLLDTFPPPEYPSPEDMRGAINE